MFHEAVDCDIQNCVAFKTAVLLLTSRWEGHPAGIGCCTGTGNFGGAVSVVNSGHEADVKISTIRLDACRSKDIGESLQLSSKKSSQQLDPTMAKARQFFLTLCRPLCHRKLRHRKQAHSRPGRSQSARCPLLVLLFCVPLPPPFLLL